MAFLFFILLLIISAFLYSFIFRKKLTYLGIPDSIISANTKEIIFKTQVVGSLILGIILVKIVKDDIILIIDKPSHNFVLLLVIIYICILVLSGYCIDFAIKVINPKVNLLNVIIDNPELTAEVEELKTSSTMDPDEFWKLINEEDIPLTAEEYKKKLDDLHIELSKYHPIKIVEFYNTFSIFRNQILSPEFYQIYLYIWGNKYEENHFDQFIEFILAQGKTKFETIKNNLNEIAKLDLNIIKLNSISISIIIHQTFLIKTGRFFPFREEWEPLKILGDRKQDTKEVEQNYPVICEKFK